MLWACEVLPRPVTDLEFAEHIGEQEAAEAPPLQRFDGGFRGRRWVLPDETRAEWWLTRDTYVVHMTLSADQAVDETLAAEVEGMIPLIAVEPF
jgi:hypothetical protein